MQLEYINSLSSLMMLTFILCGCLFVAKNSGLDALKYFLNCIIKRAPKHPVIFPLVSAYAIFYAALYIGVMLVAMLQLTLTIPTLNIGLIFLAIAYNLLALLLINKFIFQKYLVIYRQIRG